MASVKKRMESEAGRTAPRKAIKKRRVEETAEIHKADISFDLSEPVSIEAFPASSFITDEVISINEVDVTTIIVT